MSHVLILKEPEDFKIVHSIANMPLVGQTLQAISQLNFKANTLELRCVFDRLQPPNDAKAVVEKNWGFLYSPEEKLLVFYSILPCVIVYRVNSNLHHRAKVSRDRLQAMSHSKFENLPLQAVSCADEPQDELATLQVSADIHTSGHPIIWQNNDTSEYLAVVHTKRHYLSGDEDFCHWAVRLNTTSLQVRT